MRITLTDVDRTKYQEVLQELCTTVASQRHNIRDREGQLAQVVKNVDPLTLAEALRRCGVIQSADGNETTLLRICGITENTQNVLCSIANDIELLNKL